MAVVTEIVQSRRSSLVDKLYKGVTVFKCSQTNFVCDKVKPISYVSRTRNEIPLSVLVVGSRQKSQRDKSHT